MNNRPGWQLYGIVFFIFLLLLLATARHLVTVAGIADPIRINFPHLPDKIADEIRVIVRGSSAGLDQNFSLNRVGKSTYWSCEGIFVFDCFVQVPKNHASKIVALEVTIGSLEKKILVNADLTKVSLDSVVSEDEAKEFPKDVLLRLPGGFGRKTSLPWIPAKVEEPGKRIELLTPLNWPGDAKYLRILAQTLLVPFLFIGMLVYFCIKNRSAAGRNWCRYVLKGEGEAPAESEPAKSDEFLHTSGSAGASPSLPRATHLWNWIGFLFLAATLVFLEYRDPYFFTQDDNLIESLPMILTGCRSIWELEIPEYNPYIYFGSPLLSLGMYALTYPPTLLSYAIARHGLGQEYATVEVFAIMHLVAGFFLIRLLCRKLGVGALPANLAGLSCVLSGSAIIMGRCWFNFVPLMVWTPILFLGLVRLVEKPATWKWVVGVGVAAGMAFHVGFSQVAIYLNVFFCLAVVYLVVAGTLSWRRALAVLPALAIGAGLALPLVYQQWLFSRGIEREPIVDKGIAVGLPGFLLPYPLVETSLPFPMGDDNLEYMGHFYFFGGVLAFLFIFQVAGLFYHRLAFAGYPANAKRGEVRATSQVWTFCCVTALIMGLGDIAGLWTLVCQLPVVGFINRHPLRVMPFLVFFATIAGTLVLERILRLAAISRGMNGRRLREIVLGILALAVLMLHVINCRTAFYTYHFHPYPELPEGLEAEFWAAENEHRQGRVFSWANSRSPDESFGLLMGLDLPAVYRQPTLGGYSPLVGGKPQVKEVFRKLQDDPARALIAYGVRWHFFPSEEERPLSTPLSTTWRMELERWDKHDIRVFMRDVRPAVFEGEGILVTDLSLAHPLAFPETFSAPSLPLVMRGTGIDVDVSRLEEEWVVVNFLYYPDAIQAFVDGQAVHCEADQWQRIRVSIPDGGSTLSVRYRPPWETGLLFGLGAAAVGILGWGILSFRFTA